MSVWQRLTSVRRGLRAAVAVLVAVAAAGAVADHARGQVFGDQFGAMAINEPGAPTVPAFPGTDAFWAGACDVDAAPAPGGAVPAPGFGTMRNTVLAPNSGFASPPGQAEIAAPVKPAHCIDRGGESFYGSTPSAWQPGWEPAWRLPPVTQAGAHPDGTVSFVLARRTVPTPGGSVGRVDGTLDNVVVELPPGFVGNPQAVALCTAEDFNDFRVGCPPETQVGVLHLELTASAFGNLGGSGSNDLEIVPVYNLEPRHGNVAELGISCLGDVCATSARLVAKARTNGDFGVTTFIGQIPAALPVISQTITIWGVPWAASHDMWRAPRNLRRGASGCNNTPGAAGAALIPIVGLPDTAACRMSYSPDWGDSPAERAIRPFLTTETDCNPTPTVTGRFDAFQFPGPMTAEGDPDLSHPDAANWKNYDSVSPAVTGCAGLPFGPDIALEPTSSVADSASGLHVEFDVPQNNLAPFDPPAAGADAAEVDAYVAAATDYFNSQEGLATAHLRDTVVALPEGVSLNPSAAAGLQACTDGQVGLRELGSPPLFNNGDPFDKDDGADGAECPDSSKIGTVQVETPLLEEPLTGEMVLGEPKSTDPRSGEMFRLFLVLRNVNRGLVAKIYGSTVADPATGRLVTTFANNPEVPFDRLTLDVKGGPRGILGLPAACGSHGWSANFTPWSAGGGGQDVADGGVFGVSQRCGLGFSPSLAAGMDTRSARSHGHFSFRLTRREGDQRLAALTAKLPQGLLASVRGLPLCTNAQAAAGACPAGSKIGWVDAAAGSGDPLWLEAKGEVFLTEGYKGCPYGLAVKVRPVAGPFRGSMELSPILVRQAVCVDRETAQVEAVSDPLPLVHHGVPLRVREIVVNVDRPDFMLNPSGCNAKRVRATLAGEQGAGASPIAPFRASGCAGLRFRPKLSMRLTGRRQVRTGRHPGVRAMVTQAGVKEAGISRAVVRLPKSLALDVNNAQALCEFEDGTKPDLEHHCPKGSIVGRARAISPLLNDPLAGNVYFVKNIRIDKQTGNEIRTLPMIVVALRGEIAVNLVGKSNTTRGGKLVSKFTTVPDAPVNRFNLNIRGGRNGILAVTRTRRNLINLCNKPRKHIAQADFNGHNGKHHDKNIRIKTPCGKKKGSPNKQRRRRTR